MFFNVLFFLSFAWAAGVAADSRLSLTLAKLLCITTNKPKTQIEYISQPLIHSLNVIVVSRSLRRWYKRNVYRSSEEEKKQQEKNPYVHREEYIKILCSLLCV